MKQPAFSYEICSGTRYSFVSMGRIRIKKVVEFSPTAIPHIYNLSFGDLYPSGTVDDVVHSNNGDILRVLVTVIRILEAFTLQRPDIKIMFTGSTPERQRLYQRILRMYCTDFTGTFMITGIAAIDAQYKELVFNPKTPIFYLAFFVQRIY